MHFHVQNPRIIDLMRCVSFETLKSWDTSLCAKKVFSQDDLHSMLCFNVKIPASIGRVRFLTKLKRRQDAFKRVMKECFIPFVEEKRQKARVAGKDS